LGVSKTRIGNLRHRITFQFVTHVSDGQGGTIATWNNLVSNPTVWAWVKPISSKERNFSNQIQYQRSHVVTIRHRTDITQDMRFLFDGRTFQLKGNFRPDERKFYLIMDAEENQGS